MRTDVNYTKVIDELESLRAENAALRERARRFYRADGTFDLLPNEEDVERKRIEAAKEIAALRERVAALERAMAKVVAHTGYMPHASAGLLSGLLDSCRRIAESALAAAKPAAQEGKEAADG